MGIHFSHILGIVCINASHEIYRRPTALGIVWINASHEICKRPIALGCLYFPIRFPYYKNLVFLCFRNFVGFYYTRNREVRNMQEIQAFGIFVFSHNFPVLSKFTIPMFWVLGILRISGSREINKKHLTLECSVSSYFSLSIENQFFHILGTILLMWRLMKNFIPNPIST